MNHAEERFWLSLEVEEWRKSIKDVSIDMSRAFKAVVLKYLPEAVIVVDRFHISAQLH
jgi:transposase